MSDPEATVGRFCAGCGKETYHVPESNEEREYDNTGLCQRCIGGARAKPDHPDDSYSYDGCKCPRCEELRR